MQKKQTKILTIKEYANWLGDYLLKIKRPNILVGHGLGGVFVLEFLQKYAHLVDGVILHSIVGANLNKRIFPKIIKLPKIAFLVKNLIASPLFRPIISKKFFTTKIDANYERIFFEAFGKCEAFENIFQIINYSWFKTLSPINLPTTFLWGEKDWILKPNEINWSLSIYQFLMLKLNRLLGWSIGILMSVIPKRLCFIFRQVGEMKAAKGYDELKIFIDQHNNPALLESIQIKARLEKIIENEKLHSETFRTLLCK